LVDTLASGASGGNPVEVQVLSSAPVLWLTRRVNTNSWLERSANINRDTLSIAHSHHPITNLQLPRSPRRRTVKSSLWRKFIVCAESTNINRDTSAVKIERWSERLNKLSHRYDNLVGLLKFICFTSGNLEEEPCHILSHRTGALP
jgi:hypothetical protein